jgi:TonB family protein
MPARWQRVFLFVAVLGMSLMGVAEQGSRKVVKRVMPVYPQNAKQYQISGAVKLEVTIAADGTVRNTKVVAGHPLLTSAAVAAVSQWRYESGTEETESVVINFNK